MTWTFWRHNVAYSDFPVEEKKRVPTSAGDWNTHAGMFLREVAVSKRTTHVRARREAEYKGARSSSVIDSDTRCGERADNSTRGSGGGAR